MGKIAKAWARSGLPLVIVVILVAFILGRKTNDIDFIAIFTGTSMVIIFMAFICEYVDSTLGMGYGTALTPVLIVMGYEPLDVVPAVLISELFTGLIASFLHHEAGNVDFKEPKTRKVTNILSLCSVLGTIVAVFIAINISKFLMKSIIGVIVLTMGILILLKELRGKEWGFSWTRVITLGVVASFNKGLSGGGYGPLVTSGQIMSGVNGKNAIAITSRAEAITCFVGIIIYCLTKGEPNYSLVIPLVLGAVCSTPLSAWSVRKITVKKITIIIGVTTLFLGGLTLYQTFF